MICNKASMAALALFALVACDKQNGASAGEMGKAGEDATTGADACDARPDGQYGNCMPAESAEQVDLAACGSSEAVCLIDNPHQPSAGVCSYGPCEADCDCPAAGDSDVVCGEIVAGLEKHCYIDCSMGQLCPNDMFCWGGYVCAYSVGGGGTPYGDCINAPAEETCGTGQQCLLDDQAAPTFGVCAKMGCTDVAECPAAPATGNAVLSCGPVIYSPYDACYLDCSNGETCPDGMACYDSIACAWQSGMPGSDTNADGGSEGGGSTGG
jgi:hypothetical protein